MKPLLLSMLGHRVHRSARIGPCIVWRTKLWLDERTRIGPLNVVICRRLVMRPTAYLGAANQVRGPLSVWLGVEAALGNLNTVGRAPKPVTIGPAWLRLGELSKITTRHFVDCSESVSFGDFSTFAGMRGQIWTHGYVHHSVGRDRFRVDGKVKIGDNVYIGSGSCLTAGISIGNGISVAPFVSVTRSLSEPGLYMGPALVHVARSPEDRHRNMPLLAPGLVAEKVYWKDGGGPSGLVREQVDPESDPAPGP